VNCHNHNTSTKHDEEKYKAFAHNLQGAIREQFPLIKVIVKPISTEQDLKIKKFKVDGDIGKPTIIDHQTKNMRLGAFEVQIFKREGGKNIEKTIHSKLKSGFWPSVSQVLEKVHYYLPRVPKLTVQLYKDLNGFNGDEEAEDGYFKDMQVIIKSSYNGTFSQVQLDHFLDVQES
jgi:hypothetical protein